MLINEEEISKGLIIAEPWISKILAGEKLWEMRSRSVKLRGRIALIKKGSSKVVAIVSLIDVLPPIIQEQLMEYYDKHCVNYDDNPELCKWNTPWVFEDVTVIDPVHYNHPNGAVTWVNL